MNVKGNHTILYLIIVVFSIALYFNSTSYDFIFWDDDKQLTENPFVKSISKENIAHNFNQERYTFLSLTTYMLEYSFWGLNPAPYKWLNIILHALNALLFFLLIFKLSKNKWLAFFSSLLFVCHPLRVESVVWISERKDLLFTFFGFLSLLTYNKYITHEKKGYYFLTVLFILLSSLSKIQGLLIPFVLFAFDYWYSRKVSWQMIMEKFMIFIFILFFPHKIVILPIIFFIILLMNENYKNKILPLKNKISTKVLLFSLASIFVIIIGLIVYCDYFNWWVESKNTSIQFSFLHRVFLGTYALSHYIYHFFMPFTLSAVYPYPTLINNALPLMYYFSIAIIPLLIFTFYGLLKFKLLTKTIVFGTVFFLINISIVLHILPIEGRLVAADRYTYFAYSGIIFIVVSILLLGFKNKKMGVILLSLIVIILTYLNINRQSVWKNTETLFTDVIKKDSSISFAYNNLAIYSLYENSLVDANQLIIKSIQLDSTDAGSWYNKGLIDYSLNNYDKSFESLQKVLQYAKAKADTAIAYNDMGQCYIAVGNYNEGLKFLNLSIKISPESPSAYNNLGWYYHNLGKQDSADYFFKKSLRLNPDYAEANNNIGSLFLIKQQFDSAEFYINKAIVLKPSYSLAYNNMGYLYLQKKDLSNALKFFNIALKVNTQFAQAQLNRAWIYFQQKNYEFALNDYNAVLAKDSVNISALVNRSFTYLQLNKPELGLFDLDKAIRINPGNIDLIMNRARFYSAIKNHEKAISDFNLAISINSMRYDLYYLRGVEYMNNEKYLLAEKDFLLCIENNPNIPDPYFSYIFMLEKQNKLNLACKLIEMAIGRGFKQFNEIKQRICV